MTDPFSSSQNFPDDKEQLIARYQGMLMRQVEAAHDKGEMEPDVYVQFMSRVCEAETEQEVYDYYQNLFVELADYHEGRLQDRIIKGADFIDGLAPSDPRREKAIEKYDALCSRISRR